MRETLKDRDDYIGYMRRLTGTVGAPPDHCYQNQYTTDDEYVEDVLGNPLPAHLLTADPAGNGRGYLTEDELVDMIDFKAGNSVSVEDNRLLARLVECFEEMESAVETAQVEAEEKVEAKSSERRELNARIAELCREHQRLNRNGSQASRLNREIGRKCNEHKGLIQQRNFKAARKVAKEITELRRQLAAEQNSQVAEISRTITTMKARLAEIDENLPKFRRLMAQAIRLANEHLDTVLNRLRDAEANIFCPDVCEE